MIVRLSLGLTVLLTTSVVAQTLPEARSGFIPRTSAEAERIADIITPTEDFTTAEPFEDNPGGATTTRVVANPNAFSQHSSNLSFEDELNFKIGNALFRKLWVSSPSSTLASDGLGPLFNARSCQRCHLKDGRGHPPQNTNDTNVSFTIQFVRPEFDPIWKNEIEDYLGGLADPTYGNQLQDFSVAGVNAEGRVQVTYEPVHVELADGTGVELQKPTYTLNDLAYGPLHPETVAVPRIAPQMIGLGLLEAIPSSDIISRADPEDEDGDGISGRANYLFSRDLGDIALGRFGLKATAPTLKDQSAAAFANDVGISTILFPNGYGDCTDAQTICQQAPDGNTGVHDGVEISDKGLDLTVFYTRNLAVPKRRNVDDRAVLQGKEVFYNIGCIACHTPKFVTHRINDDPAQSFQLIWPYTDMLLHDMGDGLADGATAGRATGTEWRTPPLWGIGLTQQVSGHTRFLHDGRARNLLEAILWHGGEAKSARDAVVNLSTADRDALLAFIGSL